MIRSLIFIAFNLFSFPLFFLSFFYFFLSLLLFFVSFSSLFRFTEVPRVTYVYLNLIMGKKYKYNTNNFHYLPLENTAKKSIILVSNLGLACLSPIQADLSEWLSDSLSIGRLGIYILRVESALSVRVSAASVPASSAASARRPASLSIELSAEGKRRRLSGEAAVLVPTVTNTRCPPPPHLTPSPSLRTSPDRSLQTIILSPDLRPPSPDRAVCTIYFKPSKQVI